MKERFTPGQRRTLLLCALSYTVAYLGRMNLSASLPGVQAALQLSETQAGVFQTVTALVYAVGQIVNGTLVDKVSARRSIGLGLILSAVCNAAFGLAHSYAWMVVIWALNGAAQSMLWTPIVKLTATWCSGRKRERASFTLSVAVILGHLAAWALSGMLASRLNWRYSYLVPACVMTLMGILSWLLLRDRSADMQNEQTAQPAQQAEAMPLRQLLCGTGLIALLLCCVCNGFVRDGVATWAPTILTDSLQGQTIDPTLVSLVIPVLNLAGLVLVRRCYRMLHGNTRSAVCLFLGVSAVMAGLLLWQNNAIACVLLMGMCCAANYGVAPMVDTLTPMEYEKAGRVGLVAGLTDSSIYLGSALAGVATGALSDVAGWPGVYSLWMIVSLAGVGFAALSIAGGKRLRAGE